ncbi:G-patch domain and KOW motifs-containing protein isoform X2 [Patagioenas fasciata]|uniref:G-patch domain and KOW motifs-containing protein isoform X2 n=1 Tax=Patagioenas fasciata TaxID=372321 RepID=UPI003A99E991
MAANGGAGSGSAAAPAGPVSFGFSRKAERRRVLAAGPCAEPGGDDAGGAGDTDFLTAVEDRELLSTRPAPPPPKELIIPLIPPHRWRNPEPPPGDADHAPSSGDHAPSTTDHASSGDHAPRTDSTPDVEAQAVQELLQEARQSQERGDGDPGPPISIPMCLRDPDGATRQQPDYSEVPVGAFGLAMLRGMGWSQGEGIGRTFKKVVKPLELRVRPRGLGLGAEPPPPPPPPGSAPSPAAPPPPSQDPAPRTPPPIAGEGLQVGAPVRVQSGAHRDALGTVEGLDPETARAVVRLRGGAAVTVSQYGLRLEHPSKTPREDEPPDAGVPPNRGGNKRKDPPKPEREVKRFLGSPPWLRRDLRVRCVDKEFRAGRFYNCKLVVEDMVTPECCVCRTDEGRLVEGLRAAMLETVVPRGDNDRVMVVLGEHAGRVGRILQREPGRNRALVQLEKDEAGRVLALDYDAVCHYVGRGEDD